jgi:hypothetical protein
MEGESLNRYEHGEIAQDPRLSFTWNLIVELIDSYFTEWAFPAYGNANVFINWHTAISPFLHIQPPLYKKLKWGLNN